MKVEEKLIEFSEQIIPWLLSHGVKIIIIIVVAYIFNKIIHKIIDRAVRIAVIADRYSSEEAERKREDTLISIFSTTVKIVLLVIVILMVLQEMGLNIAPLLAGAGIIGLALGFGGQYLIKDIISGLFIILENQYRVGDLVNFDGTGGIVENITLRMTTLRDTSGTAHHVPHGDIKRVANLSKEFSRVNLEIGVSYKTDINHVEKVVDAVGIELSKDAEWKERIIHPPRFIRIDNFGDSAIIIKIIGDVQPLKQWEVAGELRKRLKEAFEKEGIEIPYPQLVVRQAK
jgi:moderate conductance mechanosensitive channel